MRRSATSAGLRRIQLSSAGCSSLQYRQPYQKKSMTSIRSPVSIAWGAIKRYSMFWRARMSWAWEPPTAQPSTSSASAARMGCLLPRCALLARHGDHLIEHLEETRVAPCHGGRHEVAAVDHQRRGGGDVIVSRQLDRAVGPAAHAEGIEDVDELLPFHALLFDPVEERLRVAQQPLDLEGPPVVDRTEELVVHLVHHAHRVECMVCGRERQPRILEHDGRAAEF